MKDFSTNFYVYNILDKQYKLNVNELVRQEVTYMYI